MRIDIQYRWIDLIGGDGNPYRFPNKPRTDDKKTLDVPGVYRWIKIKRHNNKRIKVCLYIGQSSNLYRRLNDFLVKNKSPATAFRIGRILRTRVENGAIIGYQTLELSASQFADKKISQEDFSSIHVRQAIEQALIVYHKKHDTCKLN
jgi:hypothetical protein